MPAPTGDPGEGAGESSMGPSFPQLPWQSIPKFVPGTTNVQEYVQKLRFLAAMWPTDQLHQLAPRAALMVEGTAFRKVARLDPSKLRVNDQSGVALLVDAIGGSWGSTDFEEKYEYFEKALYGTIQRSDESHDSFLSRMESNFVELISRGTKLEEVQAYVLLRQSLLPPEDKKRTLVEHAGNLTYDPVARSFRLLGSKFFNDLHGGRATLKTKVYEANVSEVLEADVFKATDDSTTDRAYVAHLENVPESDELDAETFEIFLAAEDQDALVIQSFEQELEDFLQDIPEMHDAMVSYLEARSKLLEKKRSRGFWPIRSKGFSKGKNKGKGKRQREGLLSRIARSFCRKCGQKGHWKAECPQNMSPDAPPAASANLVEAAHSFVANEEVIDEVHSESEPDPATRLCHDPFCISNFRFVPPSPTEDIFVATHHPIPRYSSQHVSSNPMKKVFGFASRHRAHVTNTSPRFPMMRMPEHPSLPTTDLCEKVKRISQESEVYLSQDGHMCHAILDTGASRCVIGEKIWKQLLQQLPTAIQQQVRQLDSQVSFRFGNNQSLTSICKVQVPLANTTTGRKLWLSIEVVPGSTPFLFSKRAFKQLGGILDTTRDVCVLQRLSKTIPLSLSKTELYLIDMLQLCKIPHRSESITTNFESLNVHALESKPSGVIDGFAGKHVVHSQTEVVSLSEAHSASDSSVISDLAPSIRESSQHAAGTYVDSHQVGLGCHCGDPHIAASGDRVSTRTSTCQSRRRSREPSRDLADHGEHDSRAAQSTGDVAKPSTKHATRSECPEPSKRFSSTSSAGFVKPRSRSCSSRPHKSFNPCFVKRSISSSPSRTSFSSRLRSTVSWRHLNKDLGFCRGRGGRVGAGPRRTSSSGVTSDPISTWPTVSKSNANTSCGSDRAAKSSFVSCRMGSKDHHVGEKAQGPQLPASPPRGSRVLCMESCSVRIPASQSTGLCKVLPSPTGCRSSDCLNLGRDLNSAIDRKFRKEVNQFRNTFHHHKNKPVLLSHDACSALTQAETILDETFQSPTFSVSHKPCVLLEVYANPHSPLTEFLQAQGYHAIRFTKADGDLSTTEGKAKLWKIIDTYQPLHIWVAPECGPWGGWNHLNMHKSVQLFDHICQKRREQLPHISLCSQLCQFQVERKRHFHLEQPLGSGMISTSQFQPIQTMTTRTVVDMCMFGLKVPRTNRFLRKASQIFSTDPELGRSFQGKRCSNHHEHQAIEGSIWTPGGRMSLTHFCATYCKGFARHVAQHCVRQSVGDAFVGESKRMRFTNPENKRFRLSSSNAFARRVAASRSDSEPREVSRRVRRPNPDAAESSDSRDPNPQRSVLPSSERWRDVFRVADSLAPRVGNQRLSISDGLTQQVQALIDDLQIECIFISRGTERFQVPLGIPEPRLNSHRFTVCMHRHTQEIHEFVSENWLSLKRSKRIRHCMPCKLMITAFGHPRLPSNQEIPHSEPRDPWDQLVQDLQVPDPRAQPVPQVDQEPSNSFAVPRSLQDPQVCEGWAPPPIALHGPKFRALNPTEKQDLARLHNNLGHPDPIVLSEHLKAQNSPEHIVEAALEYACDACAESVSRKTRRPARLHEPHEFNDQVGIDGIFWTGIRGFQVQILHCIDEASLFHIARRIQTRNPDEAIVTWNEMWTSWAGNPKKVYSDPAGEFISHPWKAMLQSRNIEQIICTEAWQRGRVERHGHILKQMLSRYDQDQPIENIQEFDQVLLACCQAKNALTRQQGYSPEQIVLGKSIALPASLSSDDNVAAHSLALGSDLESDTFRKHLDVRTQARKAFLLADNDHSIRRALLHRSCPSRGKFAVGQMVMYWQKRNRASRHECGRWHGPAKVVSLDGQSSVWIAHADRLFKCALESLRPASLREWQYHGSLSHAVQESQGLEERRPQPLESIPEQSVVQDFSPSIAPGTPPVHPETPLVTPHSSHQPESEAIPEEPSHEIPFADLPPSGVATPIDLDPPSEAGDTPSEVVLHCEECFVQSQSDTLFDWTVLHPGSHPSEDVVLAEDGLPYLSDPLTCDEQHCFSLEIELNDHDINKWAHASKPEEFAWVSQVTKRSRTEVNLKQLSLEDRILFEKAKDAELSCWIQTSALKPILRRSLNPERILRSRWVCTWKPIDDAPTGSPQRKAKARLVVLGFQDPKLTEVVRDAPTLTREGRHTVLQTIASQQWTLSSFDIKTAFLRGQADANNPLAMEPPPELRKKLSLSDNQVCSLVGNAYGRVDAPLLFYKELTSQLKKLGFEVHPLEPCVFLLVSGKNDNRVLHGIIGTHVDDGICGGTPFFS